MTSMYKTLGIDRSTPTLLGTPLNPKIIMWSGLEIAWPRLESKSHTRKTPVSTVSNHFCLKHGIWPTYLSVSGRKYFVLNINERPLYMIFACVRYYHMKNTMLLPFFLCLGISLGSSPSFILLIDRIRNFCGDVFNVGTLPREDSRTILSSCVTAKLPSPCPSWPCGVTRSRYEPRSNHQNRGTVHSQVYGSPIKQGLG